MYCVGRNNIEGKFEQENVLFAGKRKQFVDSVY